MKEDLVRIDGNALRQARKARDWTQQTLARRATVGRRTIQQIEKGATDKVLPETVKSLAEALEIPLSELTRESSGYLSSGTDNRASLIADKLAQLQEEIKEILSESPTVDAEELARRYKLKKQKESERNAAIGEINVYYIPTHDRIKNEYMFFYVIAFKNRHSEMMDSLRQGDIPNWAVVVARGYGEPTSDVKTMIKDYYGFDHDYYANLNKLV